MHLYECKFISAAHVAEAQKLARVSPHCILKMLQLAVGAAF